MLFKLIFHIYINYYPPFILIFYILEYIIKRYLIVDIHIFKKYNLIYTL